jgi:hypothetical protein
MPTCQVTQPACRGLAPNSWHGTWYYTGHYHKMAGKQLLLDLLNSPSSGFKVWAHSWAVKSSS